MVTLLSHGMVAGTGETQIMEYSLKDIIVLVVAQGSNFLVNSYTTGINLLHQ
jgi:hypothetical protein